MQSTVKREAMIIKLNDKKYALLTEEVEGAVSLIKSNEKLSDDMWMLEIEDIQEMLFLVNDEIVYRGLENQDEVNEFGKNLYNLYDEIIYQKHHN